MANVVNAISLDILSPKCCICFSTLSSGCLRKSLGGYLVPRIPTLRPHLPHCTKERGLLKYQHQREYDREDWVIFVIGPCVCI